MGAGSREGRNAGHIERMCAFSVYIVAMLDNSTYFSAQTYATGPLDKASGDKLAQEGVSVFPSYGLYVLLS